MENSGISMKTTTLLFFFLLALAGCSSTGSERTDYKNDAAKARPLDMPPDLVLPKTNDKYVVPDGSGETVAVYSEYAKSNVAQNPACVCKDAGAATPDVAQAMAQQPASAPAVSAPAASPPRLQDRPDGSKSILIGEPFDRCWLKVSQALDQSGIAVEDKDRSKGLLYLKGGHNQLSVQAKAAEPGGAVDCEVAASNGSGAVNDETRRIIDALYKSLSK
jgi:uncharacterized lipoprotein